MKWYVKDFSALIGVSEKKVTNYLNTLNLAGVKPENIKIVSPTATWIMIYYYHTEEI